MKDQHTLSVDDPEDLYLYSLRKMAEENLDKNRVSLTGLLNLRAFLYKADELIRYTDKNYAVIVMDIAVFKLINEFCSRSTGDELLKFISGCFHAYECETVIASHFRADIFALCMAYGSTEDILSVIEDLSEKIKSFPVSCKVLPAFGICLVEDKTQTASYSIDCAFLAQKRIKGSYFTNYAFFDKAMHDRLLLEKKIENTFDEALATNQFKLFIQPKVDMQTGKIIGGEALVRWIHPTKGMISPANFIPVLEKNSSIIALDKHVWKKVFQFISDLKLKDGLEIPISVNISRVHAYDDTLVESLINLSSGYMVSTELVPLELTESAYSENVNLMYQKIKTLKEYGFLFSMDDFGSGYSSMNMLVNQPVDEVKIDKAFLDHLENPKSQKMFQHTIAMLHDLGLRIIIEGVETPVQREFLLHTGCKYAQGFLFYKPVPAEDFRNMLLNQR